MQVTEQDILSLIEETLSSALAEQSPAIPAEEATGDPSFLDQFKTWATLNPRRAKRVNKKLEKAGLEGGLEASDAELTRVAGNLYGGRKLRQTKPEWYPSREEGPEKFGGAPDPRVFIPGYNLGRRVKQRRQKKADSVERGRGIRDPQEAPAAPKGQANIDYFELMDAVEDGRIDYKKLGGEGGIEAGKAKVSAALEQAYEQATGKVKADIDSSRKQGATRRASKDFAGTFGYSGDSGATARDAQRALKTDYDQATKALKDPDLTGTPAPEPTPEPTPEPKTPKLPVPPRGTLAPADETPIEVRRASGDTTPNPVLGDLGPKPEGEIKEQLGRWKTLAGLP